MKYKSFYRPHILLFNFLFYFVTISNSILFAQIEKDLTKPLRLGIIGLVHDHVHWIFNKNRENINLVGIVETNEKAIEKFKNRYHLPDSLFFTTYEALINKAKPEAVSAFTSTAKHLEVVAYFAPKGIPIMVEKPIAASFKEAKAIDSIQKKYSVPVITNYETSWYNSTYAAKSILEEQRIGVLTKIVFNTGHPGPMEIGCSPEFLEWLTDPIQNGGGALTDFGCYGANISTWITEGEKPISIMCLAKQTKSELYPKVDDDTTILIEYQKHQVLIQASWNWSHNRKDMQLYGTNGYIDCKNSTEMLVLEEEKKGPYRFTPPEIEKARKDPFEMLYEIVRFNKTLDPYDVYSMENNLMVSKILSLAKLSAEKNRTVYWNEL